ncbi:MAG: DUF4097 family beta strand repeat protein [Gemmatimonadetes bacterium]|nr:DUF4097 family beta strand repeat protein [Gemmatimonadota bacterium]
MTTTLRTLVAGALLAATAGAQERRSDRAFTWEGNVPAGRWLYVRNLNGSIRVERGSGSRVEVVGTKRWRRGNPDNVRIEMKKSGDDVIICATWNENTRCDEEGYRTRNSSRSERDRNNDTSVEFVVQLPEGVKLVTSTVNGGLDIRGASAEVEANTVNGSIDATSSGGPVKASTVNGDITVKMADLGRGNLDFSTVNGSIEVWVPGGLDADLDMRTVNGRVESDFPMTLSGRINPRHLRAKVGDGGRRISFSTVNGSVELRKQ